MSPAGSVPTPEAASRTKRIAIIQSAYVPWRGFFDLLDRCDEYVIFDGVQFAKRHWHNRNRFKTPQGAAWFTIPVSTKSRFEQPIDEVTVAASWAETHAKALSTSYRRSSHFEELWPTIAALYEEAGRLERLTDINELFLRGLMRLLGVATPVVRDACYPAEGRATDRLLGICLAAGATHYLSGPSARDYLDERKFQDQGITVEWMHYPDYPAYRQLWGDFVPNVSAIDLVLNEGANCQPLWSGKSLDIHQ